MQWRQKFLPQTRHSELRSRIGRRNSSPQCFDDAAPLIFEELRRASAGGIADYAPLVL
jgi:hypothetical protein